MTAGIGPQGSVLVKQRYILVFMCGRSTYKLTWEEIVRLNRLSLDQPAQNTRARYNVCPATTIDAIVGQDRTRRLERMRWGACAGKIVRRMTIVAVLAAARTVSGWAQDFDFMAETGTPAVAFPKPDRPVADIVSPIWRDEKGRDAAGESRQLVRLLGIKSGMTVADIGAGSGYYTVRLSPIVGPRGRVIAEDVVPEYLRGLRKRVHDLGLQNVAISLGEPHDPRLPANSLDIVIMVHMYHEIAQPYALLYNLVTALKPGAHVGIVDAFGPTSEHGTPPSLLRCEFAAVGYREISFARLTGSNAYLAIFAPPPAAGRPRPEAMIACKAQ